MYYSQYDTTIAVNFRITCCYMMHRIAYRLSWVGGERVKFGGKKYGGHVDVQTVFGQAILVARIVPILALWRCPTPK